MNINLKKLRDLECTELVLNLQKLAELWQTLDADCKLDFSDFNKPTAKKLFFVSKLNEELQPINASMIDSAGSVKYRKIVGLADQLSNFVIYYRKTLSSVTTSNDSQNIEILGMFFVNSNIKTSFNFDEIRGILKTIQDLPENKTIGKNSDFAAFEKIIQEITKNIANLDAILFALLQFKQA